MKPLTNKVSLWIGLSALILHLIYEPEINKLFFKDNLYILFNSEKDNDVVLDWKNYKHLFPNDFSPKQARTRIGEPSKLNEIQKAKFDSIENSFYKYPRKIIKTENGIKHYSVAVNQNAGINFEQLNTREMLDIEIEDLNIISLDSLTNIISGLGYFHKAIKEVKKIQFRIVDLSNKKVTLIKVRPIFVEYD